jgi:hypothetical protein
MGEQDLPAKLLLGRPVSATSLVQVTEPAFANDPSAIPHLSRF